MYSSTVVAVAGSPGSFALTTIALVEVGDSSTARTEFLSGNVTWGSTGRSNALRVIERLDARRVLRVTGYVDHGELLRRALDRVDALTVGREIYFCRRRREWDGPRLPGDRVTDRHDPELRDVRLADRGVLAGRHDVDLEVIGRHRRIGDRNRRDDRRPVRGRVAEVDHRDAVLGDHVSAIAGRVELDDARAKPDGQVNRILRAGRPRDHGENLEAADAAEA